MARGDSPPLLPSSQNYSAGAVDDSPFFPGVSDGSDNSLTQKISPRQASGPQAMDRTAIATQSQYVYGGSGSGSSTQLSGTSFADGMHSSHNSQVKPSDTSVEIVDIDELNDVAVVDDDDEDYDGDSGHSRGLPSSDGVMKRAKVNMTSDVAASYWTCGGCTFRNSLQQEQCEVCDTNRFSKSDQFTRGQKTVIGGKPASRDNKVIKSKMGAARSTVAVAGSTKRLVK